MLHGVARCYTVLHGVIWCCTVLNGVTRCYMVFGSVTWCHMVLHSVTWCHTVLKDATRWHMVLQCVIWRYTGLHSVLFESQWTGARRAVYSLKQAVATALRIRRELLVREINSKWKLFYQLEERILLILYHTKWWLRQTFSTERRHLPL